MKQVAIEAHEAEESRELSKLSGVGNIGRSLLPGTGSSRHRQAKGVNSVVKLVGCAPVPVKPYITYWERRPLGPQDAGTLIQEH